MFFAIPCMCAKKCVSSVVTQILCIYKSCACMHWCWVCMMLLCIGYGQSSSYWSKESSQCLSINNKGYTRGENHEVCATVAFSILMLRTVYHGMHIWSLQKFKLNLANTVISQENSSLLSMNTSELLDLFQLSDTPGEMTKGSEKVP